MINQVLNMKKVIRFLTIGACLTLAGTSWGAAVTNYFRAAAVTNTMGDGTPVVMWGFAKDSGPAAHDGVVTVPGPKIELPSGNQVLWIFLENTLPEPVSIVIPGLPAALGDPQRTGGRARSLTHEAAPGGTAVYMWSLNPGDSVCGTYLYHSGSHPAVQVQMGLYGALTKLSANNRAYPSPVVTHDSEATLLFSEVDPVLHDAVATGHYGPGMAVSSTTGYRARYFLINGQSYTNGFEANGLAHVLAGNIPNNNAQQNVLLRFLNASLDSHVPILSGDYLQLIAEDGKPYTWSQQSCAPQLPSLKTLDAFWRPTRAGTFPLYDRRLDLVNNAAAPGGMLTYLAVSKTTNNAATITIPANGSGAPYPSLINVSGFQGVVSKVSVRLNSFRHPRPQDVDILLVGPANTAASSVLFMSDAGGTTAINSASPVTLTFDDNATASLTSAPLVTGTRKPTNLAGAADTFVTPAPTSGWGSTLSVFNNTNPNGTWRLYVRDNATGPGGTSGGISGWNLIITPRPQ